MGETYARSEYLAVMNRSLCSLVDIGPGLIEGSSLASQIMLLTRLPILKSISMISGVNEFTSSVKDRTLVMCVPNER